MGIKLKIRNHTKKPVTLSKDKPVIDSPSQPSLMAKGIKIRRGAVRKSKPVLPLTGNNDDLAAAGLTDAPSLPELFKDATLEVPEGLPPLEKKILDYTAKGSLSPMHVGQRVVITWPYYHWVKAWKFGDTGTVVNVHPPGTHYKTELVELELDLPRVADNPVVGMNPHFLALIREKDDALIKADRDKRRDSAGNG